ncbi:sigma-70 family RNA polymerase sigma factor [Pseudalkalibacillus berkeleyi]|uniref:Sigma-70 family RNA polymerase sigma factor n=1 Tax=Pseudalkalibacillus berkeleyi TaxID=1069813 RepID=A0ABS9GUQ9_9BACL|nr:sigma-70 family RNA polymerase sigma factor [Pseudalkalibacillus berkeleyi]MCF6136419.1 sigma-70 family RNA polymerase sigma factor [Pseudalkalibacillus berkeleyi]
MIHTKLVKKAMKGNEEAFESLVRNESEKLYRTAFLYVRNKEDALDIVQEAICKAYTSIDQLKNPEYFSTWLTKILIRSAYDSLRKSKKLVLAGEDFLRTVPENKRKNVEEDMDLVKAISVLNEQYQTAIILFYYHDLSIQTIAETMDKPEGTIKTYLRRAKIELKRQLEGVNHYEQGLV